MARKSNKNDWLTKSLYALGKTKKDLALFLGIPQQHINDIVKAKSIRPQRIERLSQFLQIDSILLFNYFSGTITEKEFTAQLKKKPQDYPSEEYPPEERNQSPLINTLHEPPVRIDYHVGTCCVPVVGSVEENVWHDPETWNKREFYTLYVPCSQPLFGKRLFALKVQGQFMNTVYPDGSFVICMETADYTDLFGPIKGPKKVIVARQNPSNDTIEITLRQYVENEDGKFLLPKSTDLSIPVVSLDNDSDTFRIIAVVYSSYQTE